MNQSFVKGFVRQANTLGISQESAVELLKQAAAGDGVRKLFSQFVESPTGKSLLHGGKPYSAPQSKTFKALNDAVKFEQGGLSTQQRIIPQGTQWLTYNKLVEMTPTNRIDHPHVSYMRKRIADAAREVRNYNKDVEDIINYTPSSHQL